MAGRDRRGEDRGDRNTRTRTYDDDEEEQHVYCFVPGEGIDVVVLAAYLKRWIDGTATIQPSRHPTDSSRLGYTVGATSTLNRDALEDLLSDTRQWQREQQSREFRRSPYDYSESDTFADRKRKGPTIAKKAPTLAKPRDRRTPTSEQPARGETRGEGRQEGRGRHAEVETDNPPTYGQSTNYGRGRSRSPSPVQPDPDAFRQMSINSDDRGQQQNPSGRDGRAQQSNVARPVAGPGNNNSSSNTGQQKGQQIKYVVQKDPTKKGRHDD